MDTCVDPNVPPWKLELINRRRTRNNQSKCGGGGEQQLQVKPVQWTCWSPTARHFLQQQQQRPNAVRRALTPPPPPEQQQQQQQQQPTPTQQQHRHRRPTVVPAAVAVGTVCTGMRLFKCEAAAAAMTNFKKNPQIGRCRAKFKTAGAAAKPQIIAEVIAEGPDYRSDSSEEYRYGPGIVNKLKSKYMSMTAREQRPRPPLRRSTSMDNIVEDNKRGGGDQPPGRRGAVYAPQPDVIRSVVVVRPSANDGGSSETMKRARSMEALSSEPRGSCDDGQQRCSANGELPPPDVVKTYKKMFETQQQQGDAAPTAVNGKPAKAAKPAVLPKPALSPEKNRAAGRPNKVPAKKTSPPVKYPNRLKKKEPLGFDRSKPLINDEVSSSQDESSMSSDDGGSAKHKVTTKTATTATVIDNKPITVQTKQICVIRPTTRTVLLHEETTINAQLSDKEIEKNFINNSNNNDSINSVDGEKKLGGLWEKKRWDNHENSVVFNFVNRKGVPNYIDSEGPLERRENSYEIKDGCLMLDAHCEESSTDDIDRVNNDGCVIFVGDNIIIGRSNLRNENSTASRKDLRIRFSDALETVHEYPSEASTTTLLEDESTNAADGSTNTSVLSPKSKFGDYVPSKLGANEEAFLGEYGVSRCSSNVVVKTVKTSVVDGHGEEDAAPPPVIDTNVPWSEETTPDLLF